ncbi:hypothetical protein CWB96_14935 [Pseudoalteromonas citrea]|uniref:Orphan lipoprotein n=1 Tax=Pseudoalteromonas citrea TaxID=43655 RepID=A0A5S3XPM4_9GAMM|nr:hypothetical protein [Pseudoalteromonas citrea]TMP42760.1 hypothetical protein CWB97_10915 [Pseudoalteromonas citrea]TMP56631.1 hypothetical protein CWB96_14935 [Pseudoalteromonas citrea]
MVKPLLSAFSLIIGLTGCNTLSPSKQAQVDTMNICQKVEALISSAPSGFDPLKGAKVSTPFLTSWQAKAHLVGEQCQISNYSTGSTGYHCEQNFSSDNLASQVFDTSKRLIESCLSTEWKAVQKKNTLQFSKAAQSPTLSLSKQETFDKKQPWQVKLEISQ